MAVTARFVLVLVLVSLLSVASVLGATLLSVGIVVGIKSIFACIIKLLSTISELIVALVAALTSGATVTLSVLVAAGSAGMAVPASFLELRVVVSVAVSAGAILAAAGVLFYLTCPGVDVEIAVAVTSAAALAVGCASAWAVGVMSLIEKETQQVGLKMTSLLDAVHNNKHFLLRLLVKLNTGLKTRDRDLDLALIHAVKAGFVECTEILLGSGANPNAQDSNGNTPLIHSCEIGSIECAKLLTDVGCDVNIKSTNKNTALHHAARWGYKDCVELLLLKGAWVNVQDSRWRTPLMLCAIHARDAELVMRMLLQAGSDINLLGFEGQRVIHYAASRGLNMDDILKAGAHFDVRDEEGNLPLHYAALEGHAKVVRALLEAGADPNIENFSGRTAVHFSACKGSLECTDALIGHGGDPAIVDPTGKNAICYAVENNNITVVIYLIRYNCPLPTTPQPTTFGSELPPGVVDPVSIALSKRYIHIVKALVIGGFPCKPLFDWLNHTPEEVWVEGCIEHVSWLKDFTTNASSLCHLSRLGVRRSLGDNIQQKLSSLPPLPSAIKDYIKFKDLNEKYFITRNGEKNSRFLVL